MLWLWVLAVVVAILSTLFLGQPLSELLSDQNVRAVFFVLGMLLVGASILFHALRNKTGKVELALWMGLAAVYLMFFLRLGMAERSHLIEYSVLAILIHKAIEERNSNGGSVRFPHVTAIFGAFSIGVVDECLQIFLPSRVFDWEDIIFNGNAAIFAVVSSLLVSWIKRKFSKTP